MKKRNIVYAIAVFLAMLSGKVFAQNPIIKGYADPAIRVYNGKMYMVVGKDKSPEIKGFNMPYWSIISSVDLMNWTKECDIDPKDSYLGAGYTACWAADLSFKDGRYYFYFSNGGEATGVFVANKPSGPFVDVLKKTMIDKSYSTNLEYDPTAFVDDDGQHYIIFGRDGQLGKELLHYQIAKLSDDMVSLNGKSKDLITSQPYGFGTSNRAKDHSFFHKYNGIYYLSCAGEYMSSKNIYGPFEHLRKTGQNQGHTSFSEYNGQTYHAWEWTCDPYGVRTYRQVMMTYLHYKDNGDMVDDLNFIQSGKYYSTGVGNYSANWDTIQAEWYFNKSISVLKKDCPNGGFEIQNLTNNSFLNFPSIKDLKANAIINFNVSSARGSGKIEVREDSPSGILLGTCNIPKTGSFTSYQIASCMLKNTAKATNLFFVFKGGKGELTRLDWFNFSK